jgi:hypothetical protein
MTSKSPFTAALSVTALCLLSACNTTPQPVIDAGASGTSRLAGSASHTDFKLPEGTGCQGDAQRFRALVDHDLETGFVAKSVYNKAISEIEAAQKTCASGEEAKARTMLSVSRRRYGYPS